MSPLSVFCFFFFNDTATTEIYTLSLHDALPISRAMGGAGLVFTEMTDVSPAGRISPGCTGMYKPEHVPAWKRIVDFVHAHSQAKIGLPPGHAGRKGPTPLAGGGVDEPPPGGDWGVIAPSSLPHLPPIP